MRRILLTGAVVLSFVASACAAREPTKILWTATSPPPQATKTQAAPTKTPSSPAAHSSPSPSTILPTRTMRPLPPLPEGEPQDIVRLLLADNLGCKLPCWWGIMPGSHSWDIVKDHFRRIALWTLDLPSTRFEGESYQEIAFPLPGIDPTLSAGKLDFVSREGVIVRLDVIPPQGGFYDANRIIQEYGVPEGAYVRTWAREREGLLNFYVVLFYPAYHFVATFRTDGTLVSGTVRGCIDHIEPGISAWPPYDDFSFADLAKEGIAGFEGGEILYYLDVKQATGISEEEIASILKGGKNLCLSTPATMWPEPT